MDVGGGRVDEGDLDLDTGIFLSLSIYICQHFVSFLENKDSSLIVNPMMNNQQEQSNPDQQVKPIRFYDFKRFRNFQVIYV